MFYYPYLIVKKKLKEITGLKEIDWYAGQDNVGTRGRSKLCATPSAFIVFPEMNPEDYGKGEQRAESSFTIRLVTNHLDRGGAGIEEHLQFFNAIFIKLEGKSGYGNEIGLDDNTYFNTLSRTNVTPPNQNDDFLISTQTFSAQFFDYTAKKRVISTNPNPVVEKILEE
ncbi:hypothetical protein [Flammeovirga aprica]|uniref:Uncharacterized protein n=1 Tax=Flammeovirga aprica JL-4 TaxID=694437 RepID=A0A7X9RUM6_9BACT|nr:hypothetical protein [Flammeovirga aprica]NME69019.1 hypothetical protein [Flammeovirga aprica JL-4]